MPWQWMITGGTPILGNLWIWRNAGWRWRFSVVLPMFFHDNMKVFHVPYQEHWWNAGLPKKHWSLECFKRSNMGLYFVYSCECRGKRRCFPDKNWIRVWLELTKWPYNYKQQITRVTISRLCDQFPTMCTSALTSFNEIIIKKSQGMMETLRWVSQTHSNLGWIWAMKNENLRSEWMGSG